MSYSYKLKQDLIKKKQKPCCQKAELYGFLLFSPLFSKEKIKITCEHIDLLEHYQGLIQSLIGSIPEIYLKENNSKIKLEGEVAERLLKKIDDPIIDYPLKIDRAILINDCCISAFLRGVFISTGFISPPEKYYHAEIVTSHHSLADDLVLFLSEHNIKSKMSERKGNKVVYIKSAEAVKDFLALLGAMEQVFDYANTNILKDMRNNVNRIVNFESANIDKSVAAAEKQITEIEKLEKNGFEGLNEQLKEVAVLRKENSDLNLEQLGKLCNPPLSKSGISHRLKKIIMIAENIK